MCKIAFAPGLVREVSLAQTFLFFLPLPLGEGWGEGLSTSSFAASPNPSQGEGKKPRNHRLKSVPLTYFFISSSTAAVIPLIPVRRVGSGSGSNKLECSDGSGLPDFLAASTLAGSTAPNQNMNAGI